MLSLNSPISFLSRFASLSVLLLELTWTADGAGFNWEKGQGFRHAQFQPRGTAKDGFTLLAPEQTGVVFTNSLSEQRRLSSEILISGSGVAAGESLLGALNFEEHLRARKEHRESQLRFLI